MTNKFMNQRIAIIGNRDIDPLQIVKQPRVGGRAEGGKKGTNSRFEMLYGHNPTPQGECDYIVQICTIIKNYKLKKFKTFWYSNVCRCAEITRSDFTFSRYINNKS